MGSDAQGVYRIHEFNVEFAKLGLITCVHEFRNVLSSLDSDPTVAKGRISFLSNDLSMFGD